MVHTFCAEDSNTLFNDLYAVLEIFGDLRSPCEREGRGRAGGLGEKARGPLERLYTIYNRWHVATAWNAGFNKNYDESRLLPHNHLYPNQRAVSRFALWISESQAATNREQTQTRQNGDRCRWGET